MLRSFREEDTEAVVAIWLEASLQAHGFIDGKYWRARAQDMRTLYLPLAALFVGPEHQRKGIGTRLLDVAKKIHPDMELSVYAQNTRARTFYERHGFRMVSRRVEDATGQLELVMRRRPMRICESM